MTEASLIVLFWLAGAKLPEGAVEIPREKCNEAMTQLGKEPIPSSIICIGIPDAGTRSMPVEHTFRSPVTTSTAGEHTH